MIYVIGCYLLQFRINHRYDVHVISVVARAWESLILDKQQEKDRMKELREFSRDVIIKLKKLL